MFQEIKSSLRTSLEAITAPLIHKDIEKKRDFEREYLRVPAPNIIEFVSSPQYLNIPSIFDHVRQYQILRDFFQYRCPICNPLTPEKIDCWGKGKEYLQSEVLLLWSEKDKEDVCPKCGTTRGELLEDRAIEKYNQLHAIIGMRSGKTATAALIGAYLEHRLINISLSQEDCRLSTYFGLLPKQPFEVTYIASTEVQSSDTIWAYYRSFRADSPWFKRYVMWVKKQEAIQDTPLGMERWKYQETIREIENGQMGVKFNSKNSNSSGLAGRTRIGSFVDEISRFRQTELNKGSERTGETRILVDKVPGNTSKV